MSLSGVASSSTLPTPQHIKQACATIGSVLKDRKYAIVGGAACQLLGSPRTTEDIDFVDPAGEVRAVRKLLASLKDKFTVEPRTLHTHFLCTPPIRIEILSPPGTFKETFDEHTVTITAQIEGSTVSILHPVRILNAKCRSVLGRPTEDKKSSDAYDIKFPLKYSADREEFPTSRNLPNASKDFVVWFTALYGEPDLWTKVRFQFGTGQFEGA